MRKLLIYKKYDNDVGKAGVIESLYKAPHIYGHCSHNFEIIHISFQNLPHVSKLKAKPQSKLRENTYAHKYPKY